MSTQSILVSISVALSTVFLAAIIQVKTKYATSEHMAMAFIKKMAMWILGGTVAIAQLFLVWWLVEQFVTDSPVSSHRLLLILLAMFSIFFSIFFIIIDHIYGGALLKQAQAVKEVFDCIIKSKDK